MSLERLTPYMIVQPPPRGGVRHRPPVWIAPMLGAVVVAGALIATLAFALRPILGF